MQPNESDENIFIIILDETYGVVEDNDWEEESNRYRLELEKEYSVNFSEINVGPGADLPAFLTIITTTAVPLWSILLGAFFLGKPINQNLDGWIAIAKKIKSFFARPAILGRQGAAALAVEAVMHDMDGLPKEIQLLSYRPSLIGEEGSLSDFEQIDEISEKPSTINLGYLRHVFEIKADGILFRVMVDGMECHLIRV